MDNEILSGVRTCEECGEDYCFGPYPEHKCGVCPGPCDLCEGSSHHWMEYQDDKNDELFYWHCKHCPHKVEYGEPQKHPKDCDCPDHEVEGIYE